MTTRVRLLYLAVVVGLGGALVVLYRVRPPGPSEDPQFTALQAEEKSLAGFDAAMLGKLRSDRDSLARKVTAPPMEELQHAIGSRWAWTAAGAGRYAVTCTGEAANDWPAMLAGLVALERQPGVFLESAELSGDGRQIVRSKLTVRVRAPSNETERKTKSS